LLYLIKSNKSKIAIEKGYNLAIEENPYVVDYLLGKKRCLH